MNEQWDTRFAGLVELISTWSKDPSTKVGAAIIMPDKSIASMGYNGFPPHIEDDPAWLADREMKLRFMIHAEANAFRFCKHDNLEGSTIYVYPLMPCIRCAEIIVENKIKRVVTATTPGNLDYMWRPDVRERYNFNTVEKLFADNGIHHDVIVTGGSLSK